MFYPDRYAIGEACFGLAIPGCEAVRIVGRKSEV
jgi:hypothetical protein